MRMSCESLIVPTCVRIVVKIVEKILLKAYRTGMNFEKSVVTVSVMVLIVAQTIGRTNVMIGRSERVIEWKIVGIGSTIDSNNCLLVISELSQSFY